MMRVSLICFFLSNLLINYALSELPGKRIELNSTKDLYHSLSGLIDRQKWQSFLSSEKTLKSPSQSCVQSFNRFNLTSIEDGASGIMYLIDSFAKPQPGILTGNLHWTGNWEECLSLPNTRYITLQLPLNLDLSTKTLSLDVCLPVECEDSTNIIALLNHFDLGFLINTADVKSYSHVPFEILTPGRIATISLFAMFGILVGVSTLVGFLERVIQSLSLAYQEKYTQKLSKSCEAPKENGENGDYFYYIQYSEAPLNTEQCECESELDTRLLTKEIPSRRIGIGKRLSAIIHTLSEPFSLYTNVKKVFNTEQPPSSIGCLNGIRTISMFWVILAHIFIIASMAVSNKKYLLTNFVRRFSSQAVMNGFFSVDTFFVLSGFLVMYLSLRELGRTKRKCLAYVKFLLKFYFHRILRITPTFFAILLFYWQITPIIGDGPLWRPSVDSFVDSCDNFGWVSTIFYVKNFYPKYSLTGCMAWSWYLSNDMQFYIISPIFILSAFFFQYYIFLILITIAITASLIPSFVIPVLYSLRSNGIYPLNHFADGLFHTASAVHFGDRDDLYYIKPYCRINPYLIGLVLGYVLWKVSQCKKPQKFRSTLISVVFWPIASGVCFSLVYGLYGSFHGHIMSTLENSLYLGLSRTLWGLGVAMFIFICYSGSGGPINDFLSWNVFIPLSRLTFTAYLIHPVIIVIYFASLREMVYYHDLSIAFTVVGLVCMSYAAAAVFALFIEFPLANIESLILGRKKDPKK